MPTIIAFDTSTDTASASLMVRGAVSTRYSKGMTTHSQTILPMIHALLAEGGIRLADCDAVAFGCGPGSFTGVRTACGVAQGLAFGADLPVVPVTGLLAMAEACRKEHCAENVLAVLDARMKEVYWAQYRRDENGFWQAVTEPRLSLPGDVVPVGTPNACGNGLVVYADAFAGLPVFTGYAEVMPDSEAIAVLAEAAYRRGETVAARDARPLYLRNKVAYTIEERRLAKAACAP